MLLLVSVRVLLPSLVKAPVPEMLLATVTSSERLKLRVLLLTTAPVPRLPLSPPSPICNVPALMVVVPL